MNMQGNLGRNIPQPQGMPQGIASLGGMSPSPRAGIGNVQDRVDAFRQNPQALQTPPNVPPDLLDALALQKIMSEKEAAKRDMAMAQPGQQPTVMQQLEQKALGDTKQEIAELVTGAEQTKAANQKAAFDRLAQAAQGGSPLMSGIARAPGAGQVMPARMASGGIVAFQEGGDPKLAEYNQVKRQLVAATNSGDPRAAQFYARKLQELRAQIEPELLRQAEFETSRAEAPARVAGMLEGPPPSPQGAVIDQAALDRVRDMTERGPQFDIRQPPSPDLIAALQAQSERVGPSERMGLQNQIAKMQRDMPQAAEPQQSPAAPGIAGALEKPVLPPDSAGQGISPPPARPELEAPFTQAAKGILTRDPEAMARAAQERYGAAMDPAEAQRRKFMEELIAQKRKSLEGMPSPREQAMKELFAGFRNVGAGGQRGIGGFTAGQQATAQGYQQQRQSYQDELNKLLMGEANRGVELAGKRYGVGEEARAGVGADIRAAMPSAGSVISAQLGEQSAAADRASQERRLGRQIAAQRELKQMEIDNPEWKSKLEYAMRNPQAAALMFPKGDKAALDYLKLHVDLKQSEMQALANDLSPGAAERKKVLAAEVATLSKALGELSGVPLSQPRPSAPAVGTVMQGYRFKGGDPSDRKNWEKV